MLSQVWCHDCFAMASHKCMNVFAGINYIIFLWTDLVGIWQVIYLTSVKNVIYMVYTGTNYENMLWGFQMKLSLWPSHLQLFHVAGSCAGSRQTRSGAISRTAAKREVLKAFFCIYLNYWCIFVCIFCARLHKIWNSISFCIFCVLLCRICLFFGILLFALFCMYLGYVYQHVHHAYFSAYMLTYAWYACFLPFWVACYLFKFFLYRTLHDIFGIMQNILLCILHVLHTILQILLHILLYHSEHCSARFGQGPGLYVHLWYSESIYATQKIILLLRLRQSTAPAWKEEGLSRLVASRLPQARSVTLSQVRSESVWDCTVELNFYLLNLRWAGASLYARQGLWEPR